MNSEIILTLTSTFEAHAQQTEGGTEYWLAPKSIWSGPMG